VTERTLEYWRAQGLLPRPERTGQDGKRPIWRYPPQAAEQLASLLWWRRGTQDPNVLRAALWYDGFSVDMSRVRASIAACLRKAMDAFEKELAKRTDDPKDPNARLQAMHELAGTAAGMRANGLPRFGRQTLEERSAGTALLLGVMMNDATVLARLEKDAPALERLVGIDRGRRFKTGGGRPWLSGPPEEGIGSFGETGNIPHLLDVVCDASEAELERARCLGRAFISGVVAVSRLTDAVAGRDNAAGFGAAELVTGRPDLPVVVVPLFVAFLRDPELATNLQQVLTTLQTDVFPAEQNVREFLALPEAERLEKLKQLPSKQRLAFKRALTEFSSPEVNAGDLYANAFRALLGPAATGTEETPEGQGAAEEPY
jgi:hypothetical protein